MSEIRSLRLIVNNSHSLSRPAVDAKNFPENGRQIIQVLSQKDIAFKLSVVNLPEKIPPEKQDPKRKNQKKDTATFKNLINLHV